MNRTPNSNSQKNYAQAAAQPKQKTASHTNNPHHPNQHHQQVSQQNQSSGSSTSTNFSSSANGKPNNTSQTKPQAQHISNMGNGNTGRSIKHKNAVQLPTKGHAWETAPNSFGFGTVNIPNAQIQMSPPTGPTITSGGGVPNDLPTKGGPTFGTVTTVATTQPTNVDTSATRANEIARTHSAPPLLNPQDSNNVRNVGQSGHPSNVGVRNQPINMHQQQSMAVSHQQPSVPVNNSALHRKESVSSTHPHHKPMVPGPGQNITGQYTSRSRDKHIPPSSHINPAQQQVPQGSIPMAPGSMQMSMPWPYNRGEYLYYPQYSHPHPPPHLYMAQYAPVRPPMTQAHIPQVQVPVTAVSYLTAQQNLQKSKAIPIVDPNRGVAIKTPQQQLSKSPNFKKEEIPSVLVDNKLEETDKERANSEDKGISKAIKIVDPAEKERKEREEYERKEREEQDRLAREKEEKERKEAEEKARKEQERQEVERKKEEERLAKEKEERERIEAEEKARKELEEKERQEAELKKKELERLAREKEEKERKEAEEKARKELEEKERQEAERKKKEEQERLAREKVEKERKEAEEKARKEQEEKERQEAERKKEEERLAKEKEERERKEADEKARKEQEEKERQEAEKKKEEQRLAKEKAERERKEADEKIRKVIEEKERQEEECAKVNTIEVDSTDKVKKEEKKFGKGNRPGPLDLSRTTSAPAIPSAPLSALGSARLIDDLTTVSYPPHIKSPDPKLNSDAEPGKFKYDRIFLMQFMDVCKEKPEHLPALEAIGLEETKDDKKGSRQSSRPQNARIAHKNSPNQSQFTQMGEFKLPKTSEERFLASSMKFGTTSVSGNFARNPLGRTGSGSTLLPPPAMTASPPSPGRASSGRRDGGRRSGGKGGHQFQGQNFGHEQVVPLERTENRWVPGSVLDNIPKANEDFIPMEVVQRKVKALLNKLTLEKFDSISDQIIDYANKSRDERDGRILKEVIRLIFEKSCDEPNFCAMYAQLCRKMMERVDPVIVDENVKNTEGKFVQGGTLFRKYLLNRCQEDFEKGWKVNVPVPANEKGEPDLMSDEYYAAAKAKRHGLGLIRFIGELFKLNMLTERIMHECIKKLLTFQGIPEEEEMESLCKLMNTVGEQLDHANGRTNQPDHGKTTQLDDTKAKQAMDSYFNRMEDISKNPNMTSRIKFMLMDVIDLRSNSWKPRRDINAPKTIAEIHEDAAKQKEEADFLRRTASSGGRGMPKMGEQMSRGGSGRRDHRSDKGMSSHGSAPGNDGWINVGGSSQRNNKVGDLTKFGSIRSSGKITSSVSLAPGGNLGNFSRSKSDNKDREDKSAGLNRTNSTSNMFSVLESSEGRKSSEFSTSEPQKSTPPMERQRLKLLPRTVGTTPEESQPAVKSTASKSAEAVSSVQTMPEEVAIKKIDSMIAEYFSVLDIQEVLACLKEIPIEFHAKAIEEITNKVIEKKQPEVDNVINLFKEIISSKTCDNSNFKDGFKGSLVFLMDIGADAPMAYSFTGQLLYSAGLDFRDITTLLKALDNDREIEKIVKGYVSVLKNDVGEQNCEQKINEFDIKSLFPKKNEVGISNFIEDLGFGSLKK
ncbi:4047_t:CDS:10 [Funneliformis geosporum]|uniref:4047_t:CDS:1 n=1 Tax=Funneliformis geosporum TaxID=1117311 RepID=A0A9W4SNT8_9GLOM|nr:4047_t:CDS:10 [Funneliformis geosporum]